MQLLPIVDTYHKNAKGHYGIKGCGTFKNRQHACLIAVAYNLLRMRSLLTCNA